MVVWWFGRGRGSGSDENFSRTRCISGGGGGQRFLCVGDGAPVHLRVHEHDGSEVHVFKVVAHLQEELVVADDLQRPAGQARLAADLAHGVVAGQAQVHAVVDA